MTRRPKILVFDSGLGGLTVFAEVLKIRPHADFVYCADDAGFPYGPLSNEDLVARVLFVVQRLIETEAPDMAVIACNTASTLALPPLRARWPHIPFVGTVPAIKPAAQRSRSRMICVLATPGTVARDYTRSLIASFAEDCAVTLVGSGSLASLAEDFMRGAAISDADVAREIAPCFVEGADGARTDAIVLACTHYPLLNDFFERSAPWPVEWIDPAPAIARQADRLLAEKFGADAPSGTGQPERRAIFTSGRQPEPALEAALARYGLTTAKGDAAV
ncbi:MAG: glutamate racemase [Methylocystaceae bacterium]|nr:MAG: glutamate racemase [Methylocystaceae bacterium]